MDEITIHQTDVNKRLKRYIYARIVKMKIARALITRTRVEWKFEEFVVFLDKSCDSSRAIICLVRRVISSNYISIALQLSRALHTQAIANDLLAPRVYVCF